MNYIIDTKYSQLRLSAKKRQDMKQKRRSHSENLQRVERLSAVLATLYFVARREYSTDLTHRAVRVLQLAAYRDDPPRIEDVANYLGCALSTASELVKRLQKKGLVVRQRSATDERVVQLELTDEGRQALVEHTSLDPNKLELGFGTLSVGEQKEIIRLVEEMTRRVKEQSNCH